RGITSLIGFALLLSGMLALVLSLVNVQLAFLTWIDGFGRGVGLVFRLAMMVSGLIIIVLTRSDFEGRGRV
ncbi:MAG: hypothetical protein AB8F74_11485, partial [Saprospiraceae bacterium]